MALLPKATRVRVSSRRLTYTVTRLMDRISLPFTYEETSHGRNGLVLCIALTSGNTHEIRTPQSWSPRIL